MYKKSILLLSIILLLMCLLIFINYHKHVKAQTTFKQAISNQQKTNKEVDQWHIKAESFKDECRKQNMLIVLEGTRKVKCTISNKDDIITSKTSPLHRIQDWFDKLKTKTMIITSTYDYELAYDMNNLHIEDNVNISTNSNSTNNHSLHIILTISDIRLRPVSERKEDTIVETEEGLLCKFSSQETNAIMLKVNDEVHNGLVTDRKLYEKALNVAEDNIKELADKMGINVDIEVIDVYQMENTDAEVIEDNNIND